MIDAEIIKDWKECLSYAESHELNLMDSIPTPLIKKTVEMLERQQAEISELKNVIESNERDYVNTIKRMFNAHHLSKQVLRLEVAKEFAEKLKEKLWSPTETWLTDDIVTEAQIDEVLKKW